MAAAANGTFTVRIKSMTGGVIEIRDRNMTTQVEVLKSFIAVTYLNRVHPNNVNLMYRTNNVDLGYIELLYGTLGEYGIDFFDPTIELDMLVGPAKQIYDDNSPQVLATLLSNPEYLVNIPVNTAIVQAVSPELNFRKIYILNHPGDQTGLPCTVKYINVPHMLLNGTLDTFNETVIDPDKPEIRLSMIADLTSSLLYTYIKEGRVKVKVPVHGGRKKRTRRTRRKLHKKRTHRKRRNHKRMLR
jgi:hypothetical protein